MLSAPARENWAWSLKASARGYLLLLAGDVRLQSIVLSEYLGRPYESSAQRQAALQPFIDGYNRCRPHSALNHQPPMSRIPAMYNLLRLNN